jgi:energy-coupling factor transport system substrate-specific component
MKAKKSLFKDFTTLALVLIPVGIAINYVGGLLVKLLQLPLFLDAIGTVVVSIVAGPWVGALTGTLYNIIFGLTVDPVYIPYAICNIAFALIAGFMARSGWFEKWYKVILVAVFLVIGAVITSVPLDVLLFGGAAQGAAGIFQGYLIAIGVGIWKAVFATSIVREVADKTITAFVSYFIYKALPARFLSKFPGGAYNYIKRPTTEIK